MERKLTDLLPERYLNSPEVGAAAGILWVLGETFRARAGWRSSLSTPRRGASSTGSANTASPRRRPTR